MKSSTLHRSNLTKERMSMLENVKFQGKRSSVSNQFIRVNKTPELDVLYRSLGKNTLKKSVSQGSNSASGKTQANPKNVFLGLGLIGGAIFLVLVGLIVWISSIPSNKNNIEPQLPKTKANLEVISDTKDIDEDIHQEKYTIKSGDTLNKITYRFYGKYDAKKIEEIKRINNITSAEGLQVGQVLLIPLDR